MDERQGAAGLIHALAAATDVAGDGHDGTGGAAGQTDAQIVVQGDIGREGGGPGAGGGANQTGVAAGHIKSQGTAGSRSQRGGLPAAVVANGQRANRDRLVEIDRLVGGEIHVHARHISDGVWKARRALPPVVLAAGIVPVKRPSGKWSPGVRTCRLCRASGEGEQGCEHGQGDREGRVSWEQFTYFHK